MAKAQSPSFMRIGPVSPFFVPYIIAYKHGIAGTCAGVFSKFFLQPLDLVKTRMQVHDGSVLMKSQAYRGIWDALRTIIRVEGVVGLYKGLGANLLGSGLAWGIYFFTYDRFKKYAMSWQADQKYPSPLSSLGSAVSAGMFTTLLTNPIWMIKTRLQLQSKEIHGTKSLYTGTFNAIYRIASEEGFRALYRGIIPSLSLCSNGALQFLAYEELKKLSLRGASWSGVKHHDDFHSGHFLVMGALAKIFSTSITYPLQVTRSRLYQRKPAALPTVGFEKRKNAKYQGFVEVLRAIRSQGYRAFYQGILAQLLKTAPASALTFMSYELVKRVLDGITKEKKQH